MVPVLLALGNQLFAQSYLKVGFDESRFFGSVLDVATGIFCVVLFAITLWAWVRRDKQRSLFVVSMAFLVFLFRQIIEFIPLGYIDSQLAGSILDFLALALFFVGLVIIGPQKKSGLKDLR
jgi:hypothetical protein